MYDDLRIYYYGPAFSLCQEQSETGSNNTSCRQSKGRRCRCVVSNSNIQFALRSTAQCSRSTSGLKFGGTRAVRRGGWSTGRKGWIGVCGWRKNHGTIGCDGWVARRWRYIALAFHGKSSSIGQTFVVVRTSVANYVLDITLCKKEDRKRCVRYLKLLRINIEHVFQQSTATYDKQYQFQARGIRDPSRAIPRIQQHWPAIHWHIHI